VSLRVQRSERTRHLLLRASNGEQLPDGLIARLRDEQVSCGWLRASGVLVDVELRAFDPELGTLGSTRRIAGPVQAISLEGAIGLVAGQPSVSLRGLLARETDRGLETLAGEIASARAIALEALVTVLDDVAVERALDESAGVWLFGGFPEAGAPRPAPAPARPPTASAWSAAVEASEEAEAEAPVYGRDRAPARGTPAQVPQRPARPALDLDLPMPEAGDRVDHFAFGRCDVLKSDGDRLHLRLHKDGRIREIALEMLRVTREEDSDGKRRFKLERRI
jgi:predicted DNA-binding protein with PD1-like motif